MKLEESNSTLSDERHERGLAALLRIAGPDAAAPILAAGDIAPDLVRFAIDFAFGEVLSRPGLDVKTRELCTIAALAAMGHAAPQLKWHVEAAVNVGAQEPDVEEVKRIGASYARQSAATLVKPGTLDPVTRELAIVALLTAIGTQPAALKNHVRAAMTSGATRAQVIEVIEQMVVYAGFPAALNGIAAAREVFAEGH